jgi:tetratricopeptide (TPR) repeat protein
MVRHVFAAVVVVLAVAAPARAQLDPEPKQPYLWRVVLSAKPHPLLTPEFRERVRRDVLAALQPGLGAHGTAEVIDLAELPRDRWDPLWQQFDDKGFAALDAPRDLTGVKTHFLRIEYRDGRFHLESRQYDGFTGLSSPLVRAQSTRAPELVGRSAGLMIDRDFGLAGTVEPVAGKPDEVKVLVRGGGLGPVDRLVHTGDVFAVAAVRRTNREAPPPIRTATGKIIAPPPGSVPPPGLTSTPRDFTLLKVTDVSPDGTLRCAVLTRYQTAMPTAGGVVGYRCMKLGTVRAPVAVRLRAGDGSIYKTASNVSVRASDAGFPSGPAESKEVCNFDSKTAQFRSQRPLANVACITVSLGASQKRFPVPILDDGPITLPFEINPQIEEKIAFERAVLNTATAAADARLAQSVCYQTVAKLIDQQKNSDALARAKGGFQSADAADKGLTDEVARLREQLDKSPEAKRVLDTIEQNLTALRKYNADLGAHIKTLEGVVKRENDPSIAAKELQAETINARITLLLARGDVDEALAAYDQLIVILGADADVQVRPRRDKLAAEWKPKDEQHAKARDYLLKTWPAVATVQDFKDSLPLVLAHVETCKQHGDKWTMRKLLTIFSTAAVKLNDLVAPLDPASDSDRKLLADANDAGKQLARLEQELREFVKE